MGECRRVAPQAEGARWALVLGSDWCLQYQLDEATFRAVEAETRQRVADAYVLAQRGPRTSQ